MNSKFVPCAIAAVLLTGCGTIAPQRMDASVGNGLKGQAVARTVRPTPDFAVMTAAKAAFGAFGGAGMLVEGNKLVAEHKIADPAVQIATDLQAALRAQRGTADAAAPVSVDSVDVGEIAAASKGAGKYALDVKTLLWQITYFPTDWAHYRLVYSAQARLIDTETNAVLAQGSCKSMPETNAGAPTYPEMVAEDAAWIRLEMARAASACVDSLKTEMLAL